MQVRGLFLVSVCCSLVASAETQRFALVVGNNAGRPEMPALRYAESDAGKMARVLVELGDVAPDHVLLLQGRKAADIDAALEQLRDLVAPLKKNPDARTVLLFYFSGHSDGEAIELGAESVSYSRLKSMLSGVGTDVRVTIVDACRSGAGFRQKGGKPAEAFSIKMTDTLNASGDAFITSSAEDEASLESSEVMGSIFTHNLVSGLRGAADASGDKQVTLSEAYRYAYEQTVSRTAMLPVGAQHPSYDYRLSGQGELVLSSLLKPSAVLLIPRGAERTIVTEVLRDQVVFESTSGVLREIAIPPGQYSVRLFKDGRSFGGRITLSEGARKELGWDEVAPLANAVIITRKGGVTEVVKQEAPWQDDRVASLVAGVVPGVSDVGLQAALRVAIEPRSGWGLSFALVGAMATVASVTEGTVEGRAGYRFAWQQGPFWWSLGGEAGPALIAQKTSHGTAATLGAVVAPRGVARLTVFNPFAIELDVEGAVAILQANQRVTAVFRPSATLGVAVRF